METNHRIVWWIAGGAIAVIALGAVFFLEKSDTSVPSFEGQSSPRAEKSKNLAPSETDTTAQKGIVPFQYQGRDLEEVRPNSKEVGLMRLEDREKLYQEIRDTGRALKEHPELGQSWLQLGLLKKVIGDYEGARDAWEYIALINPVHHIPSQNLGELYWRYLPNYSKAEEKFRAAIRINPVDSTVYLSLSELYRTASTQKKDQADDLLLVGLNDLFHTVQLIQG